MNGHSSMTQSGEGDGVSHGGNHVTVVTMMAIFLKKRSKLRAMDLGWGCRYNSSFRNRNDIISPKFSIFKHHTKNLDNPMSQRQALPIGIQTFESLRSSKDDFLYIDKTAEIYEMTKLSVGYYFLSRPRRFGKSMLCSTLQSLFEGKQELFGGLYIHDKWDWSVKLPVVRIDLSAANYKDLDAVEARVWINLNRNAEFHGVELKIVDSLGGAFEELILRIYQKYDKKVVVLIDEYDKPIQDTLSNDDDLASKSLDVLRGFYSAIKASDQYIRFCFMTGITKFTGVGLFSGANNFEDITLDPQYASICGFTQQELNTCFGDYFDGINMAEVQAWYNGYNYLGDRVYNPYDILLFLKKQGKFDNYWWDSGQPSFLTKMFEKGAYETYDLENLELSSQELKQFTLSNLNLPSLLWQAGYLTITEEIQEPFGGSSYVLATPNREVRMTLNMLFLISLTSIESSRVLKRNEAVRSLFKNDLDGFEASVRAMFAAIPFNNYVQNNIQKYEGYYASVMFSFLAGLGLKCKTEESISTGRIDMVMESPTHIYVIEFKVNAPKPEGDERGEALNQIHKNKYYEPYLNDDRKIVLIGMHFSEEKRNLDWFEDEELKID
ncbi:ATPase AAA (plasmid) [Persicobacter psychrovividus]|uniref:ATPase AAA n=2 Tax=Persicobacter psychrovividus TaxID=387638 RepID=A0ABM7VLU3_9BACT|nr:ATPase AAA [Persicobacter psychrovividus]